MLIQLELASFGVDPGKNTPVILLKESGGQRTLAVPIGPFEASAIAINSLGVTIEKPQVIDLTKMIMDTLGGTLQRLVVGDGDGDEGFVAQLHITRGKNTYLLECAAGHAIVFALRCATDIYVSEAFLEKQQSADAPSAEQLLRRHIASLDTIDFGKYHLE